MSLEQSGKANTEYSSVVSDHIRKYYLRVSYNSPADYELMYLQLQLQ